MAKLKVAPGWDRPAISFLNIALEHIFELERIFEPFFKTSLDRNETSFHSINISFFCFQLAPTMSMNILKMLDPRSFPNQQSTHVGAPIAKASEK